MNYVLPSKARDELTMESEENTMVHIDSEDSEDDMPVAPMGRLAARMQAQAAIDEESSVLRKHDHTEGTAYDEVSKSILGQNMQLEEAPDLSASSFEDEMPAVRRRKRLLRARKPPSTRGSSPRSPSPLFVPRDSPALEGAATVQTASGSEDKEENLHPLAAKLALLAQKRLEREERERLEARKKAEEARSTSDLHAESSSDGSETGKRMAEQSRPTRRASKRALLEMKSETQRMTRNMQLTHQATTKKKIPLNSFLARFGFKGPEEQNATRLGSSETPEELQSTSDTEVAKQHSTPPTSPPPVSNSDDKSLENAVEGSRPTSTTEATIAPVTNDPPSIGDTASSEAVQRADRGTQDLSTATVKPPIVPEMKKRPIRVKVSRQSISQRKDDSESDLEIVTSPAKPHHVSVFNNLASRNAQPSSSSLKFRTLAQLASPTRQKHKGMTLGELGASLLGQAKLQAKEERGERLQELRNRGIIIETAEDRVLVEEEVENLMEKAQEEAAEVARREREAAKKEKQKTADGVYLDDSEDEAYADDEDGMLSDSGDEDDEEGDVDVQSTDDEDEGDRVEHDEADQLIEREAAETDASDFDEATAEHTEASDLEDAVLRRRKRAQRIISDDEDEDEDLNVISPPKSFKNPIFPNLQASSTPLMELSQAFAATLADSQPDTEQDSLAVLRGIPGPDLPFPELLEPDSQEIIRDSQQGDMGSIDLFAGYTQSETRVSESPAPQTLTQLSQIPEPTQDVGFVFSPFDQRRRFRDPPASTMDTLLINDGSPAAKIGGKRLRRGRAPGHPDKEDQFLIKPSAFDIMRKAAGKQAIPYDKKASKAREVVDEIAVESEDEYAGLGGASDDSDGQEDELDKNMINDNNGEVVDEKELAALNADHERQRDEKEVNKLLRDITTGGLRRKRAAGDDFDLSESDDERRAEARRAKQREFARMRKALVADEKIGQIADNPKKAAFFRTIEDTEDLVEADILQSGSGAEENVSSQDPGAAEPGDNSSAERSAGGTSGALANNKKRKRALEAAGSDVLNRPPPQHRRVAAATKKPASLAEIRESVSFLIEGPSGLDLPDLVPVEEGFSDEERHHNVETSPSPIEEDGPSSHSSSPRPRSRTRAKVSDRLSLLRRSISSSSSSHSSKLAFHTASSSETDPKALRYGPPLLRRTTTASSSNSSTSTSGSSLGDNKSYGTTTATTTAPRIAPQTKRGSVNYYTAAREREREWELNRKGKSNRARNELLARRDGPSKLDRLAALPQWD